MFIRLNGIPISVADGSVSIGSSRFGQYADSVFGRPRGGDKGYVKNFSMTTIPILPDAAESIVGLSENLGHWFGFETDAWSDNGASPTAGTYGLATGGFAGAAKRLSVTSGDLSFELDLRGGKWTVAYARTDDFGTTWDHVVVRSDGIRWLNGVRNDSATSGEMYVSNGTVTISDLFEYGAMLVLPFRIGEEHGGFVYSDIVLNGSFPVHRKRMSGDIVSGNVLVSGQHTGSEFVQASKNNLWCNNLLRVSFDLVKVGVK